MSPSDPPFPATSLARFECFDLDPLRDPLLILAYSGWSDGGDAATTAASYLCETLESELFARMDGEEFYDFTVVRPQAELDSEGRRVLRWPDQELYLHRSSDPEVRDLLISVGEEPHLRWRTFASSLVTFVHQIGVRQVVQLGAYLADVIYSQPIQIGMTSTDPEWVRRFELRAPRYQGATGILSVLTETFEREGVRTATLWAPIPHYVSTRPNPRGALALLQKAEQLIDRSFDMTRLRELVAAFDEEVSEAITSDPQLAAYVRELKRRAFSQ